MEGSSTSSVKIDSLNVANIVATEKVLLDIVAGKLVLQDGTILYFTDGTEADSAYISHDGTDLVLTGDGGTTALELEGLNLILSNDATIDNVNDNAIEFNENSDELIWTFGSNTITASSGDVTLFDYGTINLATDALDLSEGNIGNVGEVALDLVDDDDGAIAIGDNDETVAINSSDWDITTVGNMSGIGTFGADGTATWTMTTGTALTVAGTPTKILSAGSYGSKLDIAEGSTVEMVTIAGETTEDDFLIGEGIYLRTTGEDGKGFGASFLVEATNTTGTPTLEGAQIMAFLGSVGGSEAAVLKTRDGDATAGMYALWLKTGANNNCVFNSGSRTAPLWVDNQCGGTHNGEEYGIFSSTGMSRPDAWAGFETTSSGYDQLFYFDETFNSGAGTCITTDAVPGGNQDARIKVYYNGTQYYIPLYR
jgi:hypothetical protein